MNSQDVDTVESGQRAKVICIIVSFLVKLRDSKNPSNHFSFSGRNHGNLKKLKNRPLDASAEPLEISKSMICNTWNNRSGLHCGAVCLAASVSFNLSLCSRVFNLSLCTDTHRLCILVCVLWHNRLFVGLVGTEKKIQVDWLTSGAWPKTGKAKPTKNHHHWKVSLP